MIAHALILTSFVSVSVLSLMILRDTLDGRPVGGRPVADR